MGQVTGGRLEIKTSGRYTYEMGIALSKSKNPSDQALWRDWYRFTLAMAVAGAFSSDATEQKMARTFITTSLGRDVFDSPASCRAALESLAPSPDYMFFFEYNFLYVLAAGGRADKRASTFRKRSRATSSFSRRMPAWRVQSGAATPAAGLRPMPRWNRCSTRFDGPASAGTYNVFTSL
jgi:hypothetical protein